MKFVEVIIASSRTKIGRPLTYSVEADMVKGQIVRVPLMNREVNAVVVNPNAKKMTKAKPISQKIEGAIIDSKQMELAEQIAHYYVVNLGIVLAMLVPAGVHKKRRGSDESASSKRAKDRAPLPRLTADQKAAIEAIEKTANSQSVVLHGATGSGKTRVYFELVKQAQTIGKGSILLVPEIGLTTQFVQLFVSHFDQVFILHSQLSERERHLLWQRVQQADAPIVIGPRSALFAPVKELGLVVIDEFHEPTYKQDQPPKYLASRVARMLATIHGSKLVLGSATPPVEDLFIAKNRTTPIIPMAPVSKEKHDISIEVVDITTKNSNGGVISDKALESIRTSLASKKQSLVFHNRRGTSTSVLCADCGFVVTCPTCELPLAHHHDVSRLRCHGCGYSQSIPVNCPDCGESELSYKGYGTKELEQLLRKEFPAARIARFDGDNKPDERLDNRYDELLSGYIDIIIGTQVVAKGLDLPKLETVVVPNLDSLLYIPDYSSSERLFQLIFQVIGRIGRHGDGRVIVQTYSPNGEFVTHATRRDYESFYETELAWREQAEYPPYSFLLSLIYRHKQRVKAEAAALSLADKLRKKYVDKASVLGPSPAFHEKVASGWQQQIVVKSKNRKHLMRIVNELPDGWHFDLDPGSLI